MCERLASTFVLCEPSDIVFVAQGVVVWYGWFSLMWCGAVCVSASGIKVKVGVRVGCWVLGFVCVGCMGLRVYGYIDIKVV